MDLLNAIGLGFKEIWAHKFRSLLTMLGIILGVSSLVAMSALVKGMEVGMKEALIAIGGLEKIRVEPQEVPVEQRHLADQAVGRHDERRLRPASQRSAHHQVFRPRCARSIPASPRTANQSVPGTSPESGPLLSK
jgi:ABC-type lipoprotein release transport system permease subunit